MTQDIGTAKLRFDDYPVDRMIYVSTGMGLYSPACIANYMYDLAKEYNQFYRDCSILNEPDGAVRQERLALSASVAKIIRAGMALLGIEVPERM